MKRIKTQDRQKTESLAKKWIDEADKVLEPKFEDVVKSAMVYGDYAKEAREIGAKLGLKVL